MFNRAEGENIFTEYQDRICTRIARFPWEEILKIGKRNTCIRYSRFSKYLPQRVQDYLLFHKDKEKLV